MIEFTLQMKHQAESEEEGAGEEGVLEMIFPPGRSL